MGKPMFSEKAQSVLTFLQGAQGDITNADIAEGVGLEGRSVVGVLNGLQKKGYIVREEVEVDGKKAKFIRLTDAGAEVDPNAETE